MQLTDRQKSILIAAVDAYQQTFNANAMEVWRGEGRAGDPPSAFEVDEVARLARQLDTADGKPYVTDNDRVVNALLLTDAGMSAANPIGDSDIDLVERTVAGWTDDQKAAAFEWAALSHLHASDNDDVVVPDCPPHVEAIRPKYGS